jgi:hypothetical protein
MKNLIALLVIVFFASAGFAQDNKMQTQPQTKTTSKMSHECYEMKSGALIHCMGEKEEAQKKEVKLSNGTTISPDGVVKMKDGTTKKLENGQCVSLMGGIGDCEAMHKEPMKK